MGTWKPENMIASLAFVLFKKYDIFEKTSCSIKPYNIFPDPYLIGPWIDESPSLINRFRPLNSIQVCVYLARYLRCAIGQTCDWFSAGKLSLFILIYASCHRLDIQKC